MSSRPDACRPEIKTPGQASGALNYAELATRHLLNLAYGLSTVADQAEIRLQANDSIIGTGLVAITQALITGIDDMLGEIQNMTEDPEWNHGVRVADKEVNDHELLAACARYHAIAKTLNAENSLSDDAIDALAKDSNKAIRAISEIAPTTTKGVQAKAVAALEALRGRVPIAGKPTYAIDVLVESVLSEIAGSQERP